MYLCESVKSVGLNVKSVGLKKTICGTTLFLIILVFLVNPK